MRRRGEGTLPGLPVPLLRFAGFVLVVACLYWAQVVLIPVALALLVTFLLAPVVSRLERWHVPRVVAVIAVVLLGLAVVIGVGAVLVTQVIDLGEELPKYQDNIKEKISDVRGFGHGTGLERAQDTVARAAGEVEREAGRAASTAKAAKPTPVVIQPDSTPRFSEFLTTLQPWLEPVSRAGLVVLLVPFMLLAHQETRNRLIRLIGFGRLAVTTRAMDEAGERVTRYLLTQSFVNATFGMLAAGGLYLIGVPYAVLFGFLAGLLRFVPYVGIWIGAGLPAVMGLAVFPGWGKALMVIGLFAALEFFTGGVLEVLLYARSAGVSEVALLVAIAFWTWAWGPIGLVLATPLTVCIVVVAKYVPELEFLWILMGDEPAVSTDVALYQRLLAMDEDEASDIVERALAEQPLERVYDAILLPALTMAGRDHARGRISADEYRYVATELREVVEGLAPTPAEGEPTATTHVFGAAARGEADAVGLLMLRDVLVPLRVALDVASPELLSAEVVRDVQDHGADLVVVGAVPPGGLAQARFLCKRLRASVPAVRIIVARLGAVEDVEVVRQALLSAGADAVGTSVVELRDLIMQFVRIQPEVAPEHVA
jgi:predicted PurR-regulated permease PerM